MATKSAISFGLVHIPITLNTATQDNDIHFNQVHKDDNERIRYKKVCGHCGEEVTTSDIVKGFEYDKDKYVIITDDDIEKIKTKKDKAIKIIHFSDLDEINPVYFDKTYQIQPQKGGEKAFELLRQTMQEINKVAIAKSVIGTKETLITIIASGDGLLGQTMFFDDEIKDLQKSYAPIEISDAEKELAKKLVEEMIQEFDIKKYHDDYQEKLKNMINQKIAGKTIETNEKEESNIIDLMEALKKSVENANDGNQKPKTKKSKSETKSKVNSRTKKKTG